MELSTNNKKVLIIAPHPDDEINLAGQISVTLRKKGYELYTLYTTNGDAEKKIGNRRLNEALKANKLLGIEPSHVFFLGYPNEWKENIHIYNAGQDVILTSRLGKNHTNSIPEHPEYCYAKEGIHHTFTRRNFKNDYKAALAEVSPRIIICPEFDGHPDHRAAALMFDEIMGELLKEFKDYKPIVLKKYIHEGVWRGPQDYYERPACPTKTKGTRIYGGGEHDLDSPNFRWIDRISYQVDESTITLLLRDNCIYKAAVAHEVTTAWYEMQRVLNGDAVYWHRPTDNYALQASIVTSSGNGEFLNDFKQFDSDNVYEIREPFQESERYCWRPEKEDKQKTIQILFQHRVQIKMIRIYEDCNKDNHVKMLHVIVDGKIIYAGSLASDGTGTEIEVDQPIETDQVSFQITEWTGIPGIAEIEVYSHEMGNPLEIDLTRYEERTINERNVRIVQKLEKTFFEILFLGKVRVKDKFQRLMQFK